MKSAPTVVRRGMERGSHSPYVQQFAQLVVQNARDITRMIITNRCANQLATTLFQLQITTSQQLKTPLVLSHRLYDDTHQSWMRRSSQPQPFIDLHIASSRSEYIRIQPSSKGYMWYHTESHGRHRMPILYS